jgi:hypothetical protein
VNLSEARAHPLADGHSIAELVAHLTAWCEIAGRGRAAVARGGPGAAGRPRPRRTGRQWKSPPRSSGAPL